MSGILALGLGGCVSIFPKAPPAQLYQFGQLPPPPQAAPLDGSASTGVVLTLVAMPRAATGDEILAITGQEAAYIAAARWVEPAGVMFRADAERAFETQAHHVRLLPPGEFGGAAALLRLDVGDFEARYDNGPAAAPTVLVSLRATLSQPDGGTLAQQSFTVREPASDDRVGPIVAAFDTATPQVLQQVTAWTDANAPAAAPAPVVTTTTSRKSTTAKSRR